MKNKKTVIVTGGAGFIGSALIRHIISYSDYKVINIDKLTYSGNLESLKSIEGNQNYIFEEIDICDEKSLQGILINNKPDALIHLAAESHVDRSIDGPAEFIQTNIVGTFNLLEHAKDYWQSLKGTKKNNFRSEK